jgi:hypothetical protein
MKPIFKQISSIEAITFLIDKHYSGRKPQIKYAFGAYQDDKLKAVCTYGIPASRPLCVGVMGLEYFDRVIELNRLCRTEDYPEQLSRFVSYTLRELKQYNLLVVSYSDLAMGHQGSIYQSCNFVFTGTTKGRTDKYTPDGKHSRHYTDEYNHLRKIRSPKHRYIYFATDKKHKKIYSKILKYPIIKEYPKGIKTMYELGKFIKPHILNINSNTEYFEDNTRKGLF